MNYELRVTSYEKAVRFAGRGARNSSLVTRNSWCFAFAAVFLVQVSCVAPRRTFTPPLDVAALDDAGFLHYLATVPTVTVDEGLRAVLLLDVDANAAAFDERLAVLTERGAVRSEWQLRPDQTFEHGTLAYILTATCGTTRSLSELLAQPIGLGDRRYALKTCIDEALLAYALPRDPVSGGQLLAALTRAETRIRTRGGSDGPTRMRNGE